MAKCPHCSETIEKLSGFVSQEDLTTRIGAKNAAISLLEERIGELEPRAAEYESVVAARDAAVARYDELVEGQARDEAITGAGLASELRPTLEILWRALEVEEGEERPGFGDWIGSDAARQHPLLAPHFGKGGAVTGDTTDTDTGKQATVQLPRAAGTVQQPAAPQQGKPTPTQISAYFASSEYRALDKEGRAAKRAELQTQAGLTPRVVTG